MEARRFVSSWEKTAVKRVLYELKNTQRDDSVPIDGDNYVVLPSVGLQVIEQVDFTFTSFLTLVRMALLDC